MFLTRHVRATATAVRFCACILHVHARRIRVLGLRVHLAANNRTEHSYTHPQRRQQLVRETRSLKRVQKIE